jgi:hypothetical protein
MHVTATFRCNAGAVADPSSLEEIFGKAVKYPAFPVDDPDDAALEEYYELCDLRDENPDGFLPYGSESDGVLIATPIDDGWHRRETVVTYVADLRDRGGDADVQSIVAWFERCCGKLDGGYSQAVLDIDDSLTETTVISW